MGRYRNVTILAAAIFIQVVGLAVQIKRHTENENDSTRLIRVWTVTAVTPLEKGIVSLTSGASNIWHNYFYLRGVRQQNRDLQQQIQQMQLEQVRLRQDAQQARRLQALLGFKEQFIDKTVAAQVIGASGSEQSRLVYLDKGSNDGIKQGMPVICANGIVGKVIQVFGRTSQVLLINDQTSGVGTILEQSRLQGVLKGKASGELVLDKIMSEEEVKHGDQVLTSGGDQIFPKGLPVGTVDKITRGAEFLQVIVRPAAPLNHLEEVLVITQKAEREPSVAGNETVRAADILAQRLPSVPDQPQTAGPNSQGGAAASKLPAVAPPAKLPANSASTPTGGLPRQPQVPAISPGGPKTNQQPAAGQAGSAARSDGVKPQSFPAAAPLKDGAVTNAVKNSSGTTPPGSAGQQRPTPPAQSSGARPSSDSGSTPPAASQEAPQ